MTISPVGGSLGMMSMGPPRWINFNNSKMRWQCGHGVGLNLYDSKPGCPIIVESPNVLRDFTQMVDLILIGLIIYHFRSVSHIRMVVWYVRRCDEGGIHSQHVRGTASDIVWRSETMWKRWLNKGTPGPRPPIHAVIAHTSWHRQRKKFVKITIWFGI